MSDLFQPAIIAVGFAAGCSAFGYFWDQGERLQKTFREAVRKKLRGVLVPDNLASLFLRFFDDLFCTSATGRPNLARSMVASGLVLVTVTVGWACVWPSRAMDTLSAGGRYIWLFVVAINLLGDMLSIWATRIAMSGMARTRRIVMQGGWLVLDFLITVAIYCGGLVLGALLIVGSDAALAFFDVVASRFQLSNGPDDLGGTAPVLTIPSIPRPMPSLDALVDTPSFVMLLASDTLISQGGLLFCGRSDLDYFAICFYTTMFTSVWVWIFLVGIRCWPLFVGLTRNVIDVDRHPVGAAMTIGGMVGGMAIASLMYIGRIFVWATC